MEINFLGVVILLAGAALTFTSNATAGILKKDKEHTATISIVIKFVGFVIAAVGMLVTMEII